MSRLQPRGKAELTGPRGDCTRGLGSLGSPACAQLGQPAADSASDQSESEDTWLTR